MVKRWGEEDDAKLFTLFRKGKHHKNGVDPADLHFKTIRKVLEKHFPERQYENFAPSFRKRARAWLLEQELSGARAKRE